MKKLFFATLSFAIISAQAQSADEVIQKYSANIGGLEAFNKIASVKMTGTVTAQGSDFPITIQVINGKGMRSDVDVMGSSVTNCYSNGKGWKVNPFQGVPNPTEVTGNELEEFRSQTMIANPLMDYKARGHQVVLEGEEDLEGVKAFRIKLTNKETGKVTTYFLSIADYSIIKTVGTREIQGQELEVETYFSDAKVIDGLKFLMTRSLKIKGDEVQVITFDNIELNVPVDEKIFEMPE